MQKPIIAVDFDGALFRSRPFDEAHRRWFYLMSILLKDDSIREYSELRDYFGKVHEVMERYLGDVDHDTRVRFARNLFAMVTIAEADERDLVTEFADYLLEIKDRYMLALITSAPEPAVEPILKKVGCSKLFDIIYKSPVERHPNKKELFKEFIEKYEKPIYYIGNGDKDIKNCRDAGIPTISVSWVSKGSFKGDHEIDSVEELKEIV